MKIQDIVLNCLGYIEAGRWEEEEWEVREKKEGRSEVRKERRRKEGKGREKGKKGVVKG